MRRADAKQRRKPTIGRFLRPDVDLDAWAVREARRRGLKNMQELVLRLLWEERQRLEPEIVFEDQDPL
ncbi:MAG TPA: hypothetical protein VI756_04635 [Blastocatellia bacterium]